MLATLGKISNRLLSLIAGAAAFVMTLLGFLLLGSINQQIGASLLIGLLALAIVWMAAERPNSRHARAVQALVDRLLAVGRGDLSSPAPAAVREELPALAAAVDGLFEQVRSTLDDVHAMAMYDPVTSLPNRIHFRREAERILKAAEPEASAALLFIDLDGFKEVNDRLGHAQGDQVLAMVANRLRVVLKAEAEPGSLVPPLLARLAGDEFTMLLPDIASREEAERIARRALEALSEPFRSGSHCSWMGASIGVALCPEHGPDLTSVMKAADVAMYHAKESGRSRVCTYDPSFCRASEERAQTECLLRSALRGDELALGFDPQLCLRTGAILGAEAVVRARPGTDAEAHQLDTFLETVLPGAELGDWMAARVAAAAARWREEGLEHRLSLKLGPTQFERPGLAERLREAFAAVGPPPWRLEIELSENLVGRADAAMLASLESLRADGVLVTISHFGSGQLALARIGDLPVDRVKLDPGLVAEIDTSETARTVASAMIQLVHALGCEAVAPGVERQEQLELLRAVGCDAVQGFLAAEPIDESGFVAWAAGQDCRRSLARA
ncbi:MAG TPA: EAL domain-containing protein [Allosphingosinicella sp.]|jgi:diguanylate cyclase (GGDEF)-like protein